MLGNERSSTKKQISRFWTIDTMMLEKDELTPIWGSNVSAMITHQQSIRGSRGSLRVKKVMDDGHNQKGQSPPQWGQSSPNRYFPSQSRVHKFLL